MDSGDCPITELEIGEHSTPFGCCIIFFSGYVNVVLLTPACMLLLIQKRGQFYICICCTPIHHSEYLRPTFSDSHTQRAHFLCFYIPTHATVTKLFAAHAHITRIFTYGVLKCKPILQLTITDFPFCTRSG